MGFQGKDGHLTKNLRIHLHPIPSCPDFDAQVKQKREELLAKKIDNLEISSFLSLILSMSPNPNYEREIEEYLKEYRSYLMRCYEQVVARDRSRHIAIIVENVGYSPASDVRLELKMPQEYQKPASHQIYTPPPDKDMIAELDMSIEDWQKLENDIICELPPEPSPVIEIWKPAIDRTSLLLPAISSLSPASHTEPSVGGPVYEEKEGRNYIIYSIKRLVQHRRVDNLEPFPIWLGNVEDHANWEISVRITCAELPEPQWETLQLDIVTTISESSGS